ALTYEALYGTSGLGPHPPTAHRWPARPTWIGPAGRGKKGTTMNTKKAVAGLLLAGTLVVSTGSAAVAADAGSAPGDRRLHVRRIVRGAVKVVLDVTGGTPQELRAFLQNGGTVTGWAESRGADPAKVRDALIAAANARIDQAVANGRVPADRAAALK